MFDREECMFATLLDPCSKGSIETIILLDLMLLFGGIIYPLLKDSITAKAISNRKSKGSGQFEVNAGDDVTIGNRIIVKKMGDVHRSHQVNLFSIGTCSRLGLIVFHAKDGQVPRDFDFQLLNLGVQLLTSIVSLTLDGSRGSERRASLLARSSAPPGPGGESHGVFSELRWSATPSSSPHCLLSYVGVIWDAEEKQESMKSHGQPPTSSSPVDGRSVPVALPSSLSPAEAAAGGALRKDNSWDPASLSGAVIASLMLFSIIQTINALD
nr:PREDICTED: uncharacterized protein LOC104046662 [Phalacrocorax carbo]